MADLMRTPIHERHVSLGGAMTEYNGWDMPLSYPSGIVNEHLMTRKSAGLFDVSHMGRFVVRGRDNISFLQHVLTNNAQALDRRETGAQYTFIPNETGGALDDAYLYRFEEHGFLLVVNAANRIKVWEHLNSEAAAFGRVELIDRTMETALLALQGPRSKEILSSVITEGDLPLPARNAVSLPVIQGRPVQAARTGYTGEPLCYELFLPAEAALKVWDLLIGHGATPVGLGARDTLRLEAGLPLYGHEIGIDPEGNEIPIMASPGSRFAVSFSHLKGDFIGREAIHRHSEARSSILAGDYSRIGDLPRLIRPVAVTGRGVAREGARVFRNGKHAGYITSGTMIPYWKGVGQDPETARFDEHALRALCLAYIDSDIQTGENLSVEIRGRSVEALSVPYHLRGNVPPYARPVIAGSAGAQEAV